MVKVDRATAFIARTSKPEAISGLENRLLAALESQAYARLVPHFRRVDLAPGKIVYQNAQHLEHPYFPTTSMIPLLHTLDDGMTAEAGLTSNEGVVGIALFLGGDTTPCATPRL